nr:ATP-binding cassette domain-containing protein [Clostridiales bacterium]
EEISGYDERALTEFRRRKVGFVFQQYFLLPHLTVEQNAKMGAALGGGNVSEILSALGLAEKRKCLPRKLSGGEQQRVSIARALAKQPAILFLDEPTGALDEETGRSVLDYLAAEQRRLGFTMVMVTHNRNIAEMADTVIEMGGKTVASVTKNPAPKCAYEIGW